jgi:hypothetical protein
MNARALKTWLRDRLAARKFELDRIERSVRRQQFNGMGFEVNILPALTGLCLERKLIDHTGNSVKRRESGIKGLADCYNKACVEMAQLVRQRKAPQNAVAPEPIPMNNLFNLDVDDGIWQDIGLDESGDMDAPPLWLCDEKVRKGIQGVLLRDRCDEEFRFLRRERRALREWYAEEWLIVNESIELMSDLSKPVQLHVISLTYMCNTDLVYQLQQWRNSLLRLCIIWEKSLSTLPVDDILPAWGPSEAELTVVAEEVNGEMLELDDIFEESESEIEIDEDELDPGLIERLDALQLGDSVELDA